MPTKGVSVGGFVMAFETNMDRKSLTDRDSAIDKNDDRGDRNS